LTTISTPSWPAGRMMSRSWWTAKVAAARPVGAARSQPTGQPGREAETKS